MIAIGPIWEVVGPVLLSFLLAVGGALGTIASAKLYSAWGIEVDQDARNAVHSAFETGARKLIAEMGKSIQDKNVTVGSAQVDRVINIAFKHAPGGMKHFGIEKAGERATNLAVAKLQKVLAEPSAEAATAVTTLKPGLF